MDRTFPRQKANLPWAWILAQQVLEQTGLRIRWTDQSHILRGDVAIEHLIRSSSDPPEGLPRVANNLSRAGLNFLRQFGAWQTDSVQNVWRFSVSPDITPKLPLFSAASRDWPAFRGWLTSMSITSVIMGDWSLALPRENRRAFAEQVLKAMIDASTVPVDPLLNASSQTLMASDGSCTPGMPKLHERRSTTFSTVGNRHAAVFSIGGRNTGILQAEVYGLVAATLQASRNTSNSIPIYTDHLNSSRLISDAFSNPPSTHAWATKPARSLYRWLLEMLTAINPPSRPTIIYTQAHTTSESLEARANAVADALASQSHSKPIRPASVPDPTFHMDEYTFFTKEDGYIESNISSYLSHFRARASVEGQTTLPFRSLYDQHAPPDHPYTRAPSAYSAVIQLYARSQQLPTAFSQFRRSFNTLPWCRTGCKQLETPHHIFVECPSFEAIRINHKSAIVGHTRTLLDSSEGIVDDSSKTGLITLAENLLHDHEVWPTGQSQYFLGMIPSVNSTLPDFTTGTPHKTVARTRVMTRLANTWHTEVIRVASRIWGELQRRCNHQRTILMRKEKEKLGEIWKSLPTHVQRCIPGNIEADL
ncbi:hypothetical protein R3P38DRAFT_2696655 [Favolaschia claudopus]|uniref:RNase H type-1 domain-containing protein n=1 Tax=Favolaschia claudopus TaxID=2862362 RepID=A0AAW0CG91_9AGAR